VGGHTDGLQVMRVKTQRGWVVLAADASHFYANFEQMRAYATVYNVGDMLEGFATVKRLASSPAHVIPGHDPLVLRHYPAPKPELEGIRGAARSPAARLDTPRPPPGSPDAAPAIANRRASDARAAEKRRVHLRR